ncbi:MAG: hypothetical protein QOJ26_1393 [Thermoplasmata archaeon]|nr:hypothetical protein [Thermoplasmata archaeon]
MRKTVLFVLALALLVPATSGAVEQRREASFAMAKGFEDRLTIVSGAMEFEADAVSGSSSFFRTSAVQVTGLTRVCWQVIAGLRDECLDGPLVVNVPEGASFGFNSPLAYPLDMDAAHALITWVDLAQADGFDASLKVGPSAIASLVDGSVAIGQVPALSSADRGGLINLEAGKTIEVLTPAGVSLHTLRFNDEPLGLEGTPRFSRAFSADVVVVPFEDGAGASFVPARDADARTGLGRDRLELLDDILRNVKIIGGGAKAAPFAILALADDVLSEVFNGAFMRTRLADNPKGLGDVAFAKFTELTVQDGRGTALDFDGSYTLVVGDLGPAFDKTSVSDESRPLRWWVGVFMFLAVVAVGAWFWFREGPVARAEPGPQNWVARIATTIGVVVAFVVWDWQLNEVLGSSLLTTGASGAALGILVLVEVASLLLAAALIGVPVFLAVRYGLALAKKPKFISLAATAGVFCTVAFGILLLPALVSFLLSLAA